MGVGSSALPRVGKWVPLIGRAEIERAQSEYVHVKDVGKVTVALTQTSATCRPVSIVEGLVVQHVNLPPVTWASHVTGGRFESHVQTSSLLMHVGKQWKMAKVHGPL